MIVIEAFEPQTPSFLVVISGSPEKAFYTKKEAEAFIAKAKDILPPKTPMHVVDFSNCG